MDIQGMHHNAYRCRDSEETRQFYEDLLGLPLVMAHELSTTKTGRPIKALHTFFAMQNGSFMAFFEVIGEESPHLFEPKSDFDLHIALEVPDMETLIDYRDKAAAAGVEVRGPTDHRFTQSIYLRDPNGYVIELMARQPSYEEMVSQLDDGARGTLDHWQQTKHETTSDIGQ